MDALVSGAWLEEHLDDPDLRVLDCSVDARIDRETRAFVAESGRATCEQGHVPRRAHLDLAVEFSEPNPS